MSEINIAIIGSNGFIGKHLVERFSNAGNVKLHLFGRSADNKNAQFTSNYKVFDPKHSNKTFKNIDYVYYLASETIPASSWDDPINEIEKNLSTIVNFCQSLVGTSVKKIVYLSSAGTVYGPSANKLSEDSNKTPFSPYGIIKLSIENFLNYFKVKNNLNFEIYRISNVYGIGQDTSKGLGLINTFLEKVVKNETLKIYGDGKTLRNYIYVKDVAEILFKSAFGNWNESDCYNLSSNDSLTINEITAKIKEITKKDFKIDKIESRSSDNSAIDLDNTKLLNKYPDFTFTSIDKGISDTYNFLLNNNDKK